uniref:Uncharacterized protein n=1 Tax=Anguilla anguilla TaxID=7936 RepID=A0A0E9XK74_ANGAN
MINNKIKARTQETISKDEITTLKGKYVYVKGTNDYYNNCSRIINRTKCISWNRGLITSLLCFLKCFPL